MFQYSLVCIGYSRSLVANGFTSGHHSCVINHILRKIIFAYQNYYCDYFAITFVHFCFFMKDHTGINVYNESTKCGKTFHNFDSK